MWGARGVRGVRCLCVWVSVCVREGGTGGVCGVEVQGGEELVCVCVCVCVWVCVLWVQVCQEVQQIAAEISRRSLSIITLKNAISITKRRGGARYSQIESTAIARTSDFRLTVPLERSCVMRAQILRRIILRINM